MNQTIDPYMRSGGQQIGHPGQTGSWPVAAVPPPAGFKPSPKRRPLSYVILGWNGLMGVWLLAGIISMAGSHPCAGSDAADACRTGAAAGAAIAIGGILFLAAVVDVILGVIWMVTKKD